MTEYLCLALISESREQLVRTIRDDYIFIDNNDLLWKRIEKRRVKDTLGYFGPLHCWNMFGNQTR